MCQSSDPVALADDRRSNPGAPPLLDATGREALRVALVGPAPGVGTWTGRAMAVWIAA